MFLNLRKRNQKEMKISHMHTKTCYLNTPGKKIKIVSFLPRYSHARAKNCKYCSMNKQTLFKVINELVSCVFNITS